ncbi:hypothetical protein J3R30DRAFT_3701571 [Lentinula aciculospora]|uniref:Uncharacterized protein n=1 Tax=Lentinula aciculospora TaxID=153920 RepID=A0A9W9AEM6_9AGAR|nr:hypothetical protein J3R30DRAFT_3701571 [Lentinula aciculospora]
MASSRKLRIAIIICSEEGIGGLMPCAVALKDCPAIELDFYEQATQITKIGAGITIWPSTWMFLKSLGLEMNLLAILPEGYNDGLSKGLLQTTFITVQTPFFRASI